MLTYNNPEKDFNCVTSAMSDDSRNILSLRCNAIMDQYVSGSCAKCKSYSVTNVCICNVWK